MKAMALRAVTVALVLLFSAGLAKGADAMGTFYVSPSGKDANPGTIERPFATLTRARDAVRQLTKDKGAAAGPITVVLRGGTYRLAEPVVFGPQDGGTQDSAVTYAAQTGETPVLSGGKVITGWKKAGGNLWTADVPEVKADLDGKTGPEVKSGPDGKAGDPVRRSLGEGGWYFRSLFVNGRRATRARTPNASANPPCVQLKDARLNAGAKTYAYTFPPDFLKDWRNIGDVEVVSFGNWEITRKRIASVDVQGGVAQMAGPHIGPHDAIGPGAGRWCYIENAAEVLDEPGEWYLDRATGVLTYWPREGEDMTKAEAVAPRLAQLIVIAGTADEPVRNLRFKGLTFAHTDWPLPSQGYMGVQASHFSTMRDPTGRTQRDRIPAAVQCDYAAGCGVEDCAFEHLGGAGLEWQTRCAGNVTQGNLFFDIAANAVNVGGPRGEADVPKDNRIMNNYIHDCGVEYFGSVGIWVGLAQRTLVEHNLIHDLPYTGISLGWQWNPEPTAAKENTVEWNHIHHVMKRLTDGGGIYTLGLQPGTAIRGNYIHDVLRNAIAQGAPNNGMFIDEGSKGFLFERNVIHSTSAEPVRFNQCARDWHTWKDNWFNAAIPQTAPGKVGAALRCMGPGTKFVLEPHEAALDPKELTLEAWICPADVPAGEDSRRWIAGKNANEWADGHYALVISGDRAGGYVNIGGEAKNASAVWTEKAALKAGEWVHLALTYDGKALKVFVNGSEEGSTAVNKERTGGRGPFAVGGRPDNWGAVTFGGLIDEIYLYGRALTTDEIKAHAAKPDRAAEAKTEKGFVRHWSFDAAPPGEDPGRETMLHAGLEPPYRARLTPSADANR